MSAVTWAEAEIAAAKAWALAYIKSAEGEVSIFGHAVITELKLEAPAIEQSVVSALEDLVGQIVVSMEKLYATGDLKFPNALSNLVNIIETKGVAGVKLILQSTTLKESLIQAGAVALKAGLLAVA